MPECKPQLLILCPLDYFFDTPMCACVARGAQRNYIQAAFRDIVKMVKLFGWLLTKSQPIGAYIVQSRRWVRAWRLPRAPVELTLLIFMQDFVAYVVHFNLRKGVV